MGPCAASVETDGALIARISGGGETLSVIPISNATNLNGVGAGMVGWQQVGTDTAETSSTTTVINATTHAARVGDILSFTAGTAGNIGVWSVVSAVGANTITLSYALPATPANGDAFSIMRPNPVFTPKEDSAHTTGDAGNFPLAVRNDDGVTLTNTDLDYSPIAVGSKGQLWTQITVGGGGSSGLLSPVAQEDVAFAAGQAMMQAGAVNNRSLTSYNATNGDALPVGAGDMGNVLSTLIHDTNINATIQVSKFEDTGVVSGDSGLPSLAQRLDQLATGQTGSNNEYALPIVDTLSRLYVNPWGAAVTEFFSSCSSSITGVSRTAIKSAVASNRIYVTSISCKNTSAVNSGMDFTDGAGAQLAAGHITAQTVGGAWVASFPVPLRGSSNTDFSVTMNTTSTATVCCANGFTSPY
jgi:hypothetical protein